MDKGDVIKKFLKKKVKLMESLEEINIILHQFGEQKELEAYG